MQLSATLLAPVLLALSISRSSASPIEKRDGPLKLGQVSFGLLPDDGSGSGGSSKTNMAKLNSLLGGGKASTYGYYAQVSGSTWDGSQLLQVLDDVKASGAIFEATVMPTGGWNSGYFGDNTQLAQDIGKVIKRFTDEGIEVRVRFGHEVNYYLKDSSDRGDGKNTYPGGTSQQTADNFKKAFAGVASAVKNATGGKAKMFYTPNVSSNPDEYTKYMPDTFDFCGIDYYPKSSSGIGSFASTMKSFHDKCTANGAKFAIGETGLGYAANDDERIRWMKETLDAPNKGLNNLVSVTWFNYYKDNHDYRVIDSQDAKVTGDAKAVFGIYK